MLNRSSYGGRTVLILIVSGEFIVGNLFVRDEFGQ